MENLTGKNAVGFASEEESSDSDVDFAQRRLKGTRLGDRLFAEDNVGIKTNSQSKTQKDDPLL